MELLSDNSTLVDQLGFEGMADIIHTVIRDIRKPPFTIGIFGEWGCGKTSLMKMIQDRLKNDQVKTVWFNAWKYDRKEVIWNALIQEIFYTIKKEIEEDPELRETEQGRKLRDRINETAAQLALYAAKVGTRFIPGNFVQEEDIDNLIKAFGPLSAKNEQQFEFINKFEENFNNLVTDYLGHQNKYLVVFIDDLDRCLPENAIEVMEALKLYLDRSNCIFVIGTESSIIEEGIRHRYKDNPRLSAKEYLEKIIQLPFIMRGIDRDNALSLLEPYVKTGLYRDDPDIRTLIVEGTKCNPRRIKRFINAFCVLCEIANYSRQSELNIDEKRNLAKILLIQMRFPELYYALVEDLTLVAELTRISQLDSSDRDHAISAKPNVEFFKKFYYDREIKTFLVKTRAILCPKEQIEQWVRLTKGQPVTVENE
ncbi:MAG TPA: hypothetical protein DCF68_04765 [Cyanothece sp. UBA12306]|nr:hypothetical protein [Cyanothece sp. UBA12306]